MGTRSFRAPDVTRALNLETSVLRSFRFFDLCADFSREALVFSRCVERPECNRMLFSNGAVDFLDPAHVIVLPVLQPIPIDHRRRRPAFRLLDSVQRSKRSYGLYL